MKYKPTPKLLIALGLLALIFVVSRAGSRSGHGATHYGPAYGSAFGGGYPNPGGAYGGGAGGGWYGGNFHSNPNLGTAVSTSGGSGYIAVGGGEFVSW